MRHDAMTTAQRRDMTRDELETCVAGQFDYVYMGCLCGYDDPECGTQFITLGDADKPPCEEQCPRCGRIYRLTIQVTEPIVGFVIVDYSGAALAVSGNTVKYTVEET